jgi:hypothetical protein
MSQLYADCLNEILEYLEDDKITLHSCLLVNRLWCKVSVRILWRNIRNYNSRTFSTLISCLPSNSKEILCNNGIKISTPTSKPPLFDYAKFCRVLSISQVYYKLKVLLRHQHYTSLRKLNNDIKIVTQEVFKLFMTRIPCLKKLLAFSPSHMCTFASYPGARECLNGLSEFRCSSNIDSELFFQLSQVCYNIQSLAIEFENSVISNGLAELISAQNNLKYISIVLYYGTKNMYRVPQIPSFSSLVDNFPKNLIKFYLCGGNYRISLSFISDFTDLQELQLSFDYSENFKDFESLQYTLFSRLQVLKIRRARPKCEYLIRFLKINGKTLEEIYLGDIDGCSDNSLNLAIAKFCPNLRKCSIGFKNNELETLKIVLHNCQYLESIKVWCGGEYLSEKEALEMIAKYSHNHICEIILHHLFEIRLELLPEDLEKFLLSWVNRKSLSWVVVNRNDANNLTLHSKKMKFLEKYIKSGVIRKFKITNFNDDMYN